MKMLRVYEYEDNKLIAIHPYNKEMFDNARNNPDMYKVVDHELHTADTNDGLDSDCCGAEIRLDRCSECGENCGPISDN